MKKANWPFARDVILFFAGLIGVSYEALNPPADPTLMLAFMAMLGLPVVLRADEYRNGKNS